MNDAIVEIFEGQEITIRQSDGYWNATQMCQRYGRLFADFTRLKSTKAYLAALSPVMGIPITGLILSQQGGTPSEQGTWVHRRVALKLAAWLNPHFEVWVYSVIEKLLTQGKVELEDERDALIAVLEVSEAQVRKLLAIAERQGRDLQILGESYTIDDDARQGAADRDAEIVRLLEKLEENGIDPYD